MPRGLILAFGFLTRLPMPHLVAFREDELSSSAIWFPLVGLSVGLLLCMTALLGGGTNHWLAALLVLLVWIGITGALHLDGAADMADGLGAAHRDPERLLAVMKDPHTGTFGVVAIVTILLTKLVAVAWIVESPDIDLWALLLIPAWARLGVIFWSHSLDAIAAGSAERFKWEIAEQSIWLWGGGLFIFTIFVVSMWFAIAALSALLLWRAYLKKRLGGMSGDCLGAGIEYCECALLLAVCFI